MKKMLYELCDSVEIDGRKYAVNTDFRVWIEIEHILFDRRLSGGETLAEFLTLVYPVLPENLEGAIKGALWFYSAGETRESGKGDKNYSPAYDLKLDFEYVWGAFLAEFGIDLCETAMHWWKFRALLCCLSENCQFSRIVGYRNADLSKIKGREQRRFYEKMKKRFRLPDRRTEEERSAETAEKLEELFG